MEFDTAFYHQQAKPCPWPAADISASMESLEQILLVVQVNADPLITNCANRFLPVPSKDETYGTPGLGIFYGVAQDICENVPQQSFVRICLSKIRGQT